MINLFQKKCTLTHRFDGVQFLTIYNESLMVIHTVWVTYKKKRNSQILTFHSENLKERSYKYCQGQSEE